MNSQLALDFLLRWAPDGPWCLSAVDPERKKSMITSSFDPGTMKECLAFLNHWNGKRNLYFMVNRARGLLGSKAKKEDVAAFRALHVDLDPADPPKGADPAAHYEAERESILERITAYSPEPSVVIFSGGGYGAFWLLDSEHEIESEADWERLEGYNKKLEKDLHGDHCHNVDRIMRLPGTVNIPDAKKRAKGRTEAVAELLHASWRQYPLGDFEPLADEPRAPRKPRAKGKRAAEEDDWVERVLRDGPDHEGARSFDGDRSKALWAVLCALVRRNWTVDAMADAILDKGNKLSEHVYDQNDPKRYARKQAEKAFEEAMGEFTFNEQGKPHPTQANIRVALQYLEVKISYDEFAQRAFVEGPDGLPKRKVDDKAFEKIYLRIADEFGFKPTVEFFKMVIRDEADHNTYHPLKEYLKSLKWDGRPRINEWLVNYAGVKDTPFTRAVSGIYFIAGVRRVLQPGCKYDEILVLEGEQGWDKSTAFSIIAKRPEWFTDSLPMNAKDKEVIEALEGKWIVEIAELKGMRSSQVEHYKAMLSRQYDRARLSYGYFASEVPRQCVFSASTNSKSYLADTTGNRRFWPFAMTQPFDLEALRRDVDQLWAEAVYREASGESIRLSRDLWSEAALEQARREIDDPWESVINKCINGYDSGKILSADLWEVVAMPTERRTQKDNERLGGIMSNLGWERKKLRFGNGGTEWGYARGDQSKRIKIERDANGLLTVERDGEREAHAVDITETWEH